MLKENLEPNFRPAPVKQEKVYQTIGELQSGFVKTEATYKYTNPETLTPELVVIRYRDNDGKKHFIQCSPVEGGFIKKKPKGKLPIYNRARIATSEKVIAVEGEKCVHALHDIGIIATTAAGGAGSGKASMSDWSPLAGKTVYLWPDNDAPDPKTGVSLGESYMREVQKILEEINPPVRLFWIDVRDLVPVKGDVVDFLELNGGTVDDKQKAISLILDDATPVSCLGDLQVHFHRVYDGSYFGVDWPWQYTTDLSTALVPGTITAFCGEPGTSKSFFILESLAYWYFNGIPAAVFMLEEDRTWHLKRALAQLEGNANLTNLKWIKNNPEESQAALERQALPLEGIGRMITEAPAAMVTLTDLEEWFEQKAKQGCKVVGIDPITLASPNDKPWIADLRFVYNAKAIAKQYETSLILVTHPRTGSNGKKSGTQLGDMAGGSAYARFSQSTLWLKRHDTEETSKVKTPTGIFEYPHDRTVIVRKARNGSGTGKEIAFNFDKETLRFNELGVITAKDAKLTQSYEDQSW